MDDSERSSAGKQQTFCPWTACLGQWTQAELPDNWTTGATSLSAPRTFSKADHVLGHKTNLNIFKKIKIIPSIFSYHDGLKLEIDNRKNFKKFKNMWKVL